MPPLPIRFSNNLASAILGENYNALVATVDNYAAARLFIGEPGMRLYIAGAVTQNDGGQGMFGWTVGPAVDNGSTIIVATNSFPNAYWGRLSSDGGSSSNSQLTFESLGAPTTGAIFTGAISGNTLTVASVQSGTIATGMTLTAAGGTGAVAAGTIITKGAGSSWTVNISQTVTSRVMVANDSWPYLAAANAQGINGMLSTGPHWFSQTPVIQGHPVKWFGPNGYGGGANGFVATWYVPSGYGGFVVVPNNATVNAQGDVTLSGTVQFGGASGWSVNNIFFQVGNHNFPAATVNNRPGVAIYTPGQLDNWQIFGGDGDGLYIFGDAPTNLADKCAISNFTIANVWGNGIKTGGGDGNTCKFTNGVVAITGASGVDEQGFLGNSYESIQSQTTGQVNAIVRRSNNLYYSLTDGNIGNDPLSSSANWALWFASVGADTWSAGTTYQVGSAYRTGGGGNRSEFISCYSEGDAPPALFQAFSGQFLTQIYGGLHAAGVDTTNGGALIITNSSVLDAAQISVINAQNVSATGAISVTGQGLLIGMTVNNTGGATAHSVYQTQVSAAPVSNFGGRLGGSNPQAYIAPYVATTETIMEVWDATAQQCFFALDNTYNRGLASLRAKNDFTVSYRPGAGTATWTSQAGTPEGSLTATGGSFVTDTATGFGYLKTTVGSGTAGYKQIVIAGAYTAAPLTVATARLLGRTTASTGAAEEISVGASLTLSAGSLSVTPAAHQANSTAPDVATLVTDFNALLAKLQAAGLMA